MHSYLNVNAKKTGTDYFIQNGFLRQVKNTFCVFLKIILKKYCRYICFCGENKNLRRYYGEEGTIF